MMSIIFNFVYPILFVRINVKKHLTIITFLLIFVPGLVFSQEAIVTNQQLRPEVAENVKAYESHDGVLMWTLRYGKPSENKMLVQITDIDHPWNRKIHLMDVEDTGMRRYFYTKVDNKRFNVVVFSENGRGMLTLPGNNKSEPLFYSKEHSSEGNAQYFLTDYIESSK